MCLFIAQFRVFFGSETPTLSILQTSTSSGQTILTVLLSWNLLAVNRLLEHFGLRQRSPQCHQFHQPPWPWIPMSLSVQEVILQNISIQLSQYSLANPSQESSKTPPSAPLLRPPPLSLTTQTRPLPYPVTLSTPRNPFLPTLPNPKPSPRKRSSSRTPSKMPATAAIAPTRALLYPAGNLPTQATSTPKAV